MGQSLDQQDGAGRMPGPLSDLLERLLEGALKHLIPPEVMSFYSGSFICPACGGSHGRSRDAVFPLAYMFRKTADRTYYDTFRQVARFLMRTQKPNGGWDTEAQSEWDGTSVFELLSLANGYRVLERELMTSSIGMEYLLSIRRAADWTAGNVNESFANINYLFTSIPALELAGIILQESAYHRQARSNLERALHHIDGDGFIIGEGYRYPPSVAYPPVDVGYNADMSLGALALYGELALDPPPGYEETLMKAASRHIEFFYPDGSLDGSWGSRSYKWAYFGSKTAHGSEMWTWLLSGRDPSFARAARLSTGLKRRMLYRDVLPPGLHAAQTGKPLCIHPTINRADALANALYYGPETPQPEGPLPSEKPGFRRFYPSLNVYLERSSRMMLTVSGYGYLWRDDLVQPSQPMGGVVSFLWHDAFGPVQLAGQSAYYRQEPSNMLSVLDMKKPRSTPSVLVEHRGLGWSNLFEPYASLRREGCTLVVTGMLRNQRMEPSGIGYRIIYHLAESGLKKTFSLKGLKKGSSVSVIEPIIYSAGAESTEEKVAVQSEGNSLLLKTNEGIAAVVFKGLEPQRKIPEIGYTPFPGVYFIPLAAQKQIENERDLSFEVLLRVE